MNKKGFTLIELLISISLFGLIAILLFGTIDNLRHQLTFFKSKESVIDAKNRTLSLLRTDFDRPQQLTITNSENKDFSMVSITGSNRSLYQINRPYVTWVVLKHNHTLLRLESLNPINLPMMVDSLYQVHSDIVAEQCEIFRIYESDKNYLIYLRIENQKPLLIETHKSK